MLAARFPGSAGKKHKEKEKDLTVPATNGDDL